MSGFGKRVEDENGPFASTCAYMAPGLDGYLCCLVFWLFGIVRVQRKDISFLISMFWLLTKTKTCVYFGLWNGRPSVDIP